MVKRLYKDPRLRGMIFDDLHELFERYLSLCATCKHFRKDDYYCSAYPDGIPDELLAGKVQHNQVRKNQQGTIIFEEDSD